MVAGGRELIDTLWNVNLFSNHKNNRLLQELIDTLWNVNNCSQPRPSVCMRINRYIMECK